ncbi:MAG: sulfurtransferase complex subunit TusD [Gammaproteobacteria bacterium]|nr:sulfurtransferase complex subunit TusD [Gammaproteobacteria bacterium]
MRFGIVVLAGPYQHQAADSAWQFAQAVLRQGHRLERVFFYHDGVNCATRLASPPQDDRNVSRQWSELAARHDVDLVACVAAAQRRGIVDESEMRRQGKDAHNIAPGFRIAGLGQLMEMVIEVDRVVCFGG